MTKKQVEHAKIVARGFISFGEGEDRPVMVFGRLATIIFLVIQILMISFTMLSAQQKLLLFLYETAPVESAPVVMASIPIAILIIASLGLLANAFQRARSIRSMKANYAGAMAAADDFKDAIARAKVRAN